MRDSVGTHRHPTPGTRPGRLLGLTDVAKGSPTAVTTTYRVTPTSLPLGCLWSPFSSSVPDRRVTIGRKGLTQESRREEIPVRQTTFVPIGTDDGQKITEEVEGSVFSFEERNRSRQERIKKEIRRTVRVGRRIYLRIGRRMSEGLCRHTCKHTNLRKRTGHKTRERRIHNTRSFEE